MKRFFAVLLLVVMLFSMTGCMGKSDNTVVIYSSAEMYRNEYIQKRLREEFPQYDIIVGYMPTGNQAAKLLVEGEKSECDISYDLEYGYVEKLKDVLADLSGYDTSRYMEDMLDENHRVIPECRNGGCIAINTEILEKHGLPEPESYEDLIKPEYKGLISMPNPKSSGTGYMFLKSLVNVWGEEKAFAYFDALSKNILQFTSSGSGPVNALVQGEAAIGLAMTSQAVMENNNGAKLKIKFFKEGSPYSRYGAAMVEGKQDRQCVRDVFEFLDSTLIAEDKEKFFPEKIYKDVDFNVQGYPQDIQYADMSNDTKAEKERLLEKWVY
ncbi:MAG: extracellular solute-binding protein [Christensenella hongkongensis]|uniref:extracellular solute-binding protein n=1 Tax=Christensenella hongkongensis TaxID=270498 RepID=UPI002A74D912|nr:extracellular solute-binding protein [Christensenella hongkongensis]MDY3004898.1 extracellular solute-binding protein [Christensenella hongkongensis]